QILRHQQKNILLPYTTLFRSKPEDQNNLINQALEGKKYWNIVFLGHQATNSLMNDVYNSAGITINVSGAEGFDLCLANMLGLQRDRKSTRLNSSHEWISYAVF